MLSFTAFLFENEKVKITGNLCHIDGRFAACSDINSVKDNGDITFDSRALKELESKEINPIHLVTQLLGIDITKEFEGEISVYMSDGKVAVSGTEYERNGAFIEQHTLLLDLKNKTAKLDILTLPSDQQNAGVVKSVFKDYIKTFESLNINKMELHANLDAGGYAWAKYGFKPKSLTSDKKLALDAMERLNKFQDLVDLEAAPEAEHEFKTIKRLLSRYVDNDYNTSITAIMAHLKTPHLDKLLNADMKISFKAIKPPVKSVPKNLKLSLSKFMLMNSNWHGVLELNPKSKQHLNKYLNS